MNYISKNLLNVVTDDIKVALEDVAKKHGLSFEHGFKITYSSKDFTVNGLKFILGDALDYEKEEFENSCHYYAIKKDSYLAVLKHKGTEYEFIGFESSRRKFPFKFREKQTGKVVLFTHDAVRQFQVDSVMSESVLTEVDPPNLNRR